MEGAGSMTIFCIDPGPEKSAYVEVTPHYGGSLDTRKGGVDVLAFGIKPNEDIRELLHHFLKHADEPRLVIEKIASMGMSVGEETFETVYWSGRFAELFLEIEGGGVERIPRVPIKVHLCGTAKAKDANVRQALIDRFGGSSALQKAKAAKLNRKGEIVSPAVEAGPLAGISSHCWAALAVACVYVDRMNTGEFA